MATGKAVAKSCKHCWGRTQVMWKFVPDLWTLLLHVWFWTLCTVSSKQSSMSEKYFGPKPFSASQANDSVLKSILWCIGSQCKALRTGVLVRTSINTCKDTITIITKAWTRFCESCWDMSPLSLAESGVTPRFLTWLDVLNIQDEHWHSILLFLVHQK